MSAFIEFVSQPGSIVYLAAATQAAGLLFRTQIVLRIFLLLGSGLYLTYYAVAAATPLWEAMVATTAIALANIFGLTLLMLSRSARMIPADQVALHDMLGGLEPGDFRSLMRFGRVRTLPADEILTVAGQVPDRLLYVIDGDVEIEKSSSPRFRIAPRHFIGEVSLVLDAPASATVWASAGTRLVEWPRVRLVQEMKRRTRLKLAVEALIARDMARKVAVGSGVVDAPVRRKGAMAQVATA
ncbi:MAG: cyclic nucleotide-binding domain-containing protein [Hyphomicrobiaceae bacterium]|nr:cyclic nucleotide-binding domain-containing protein [Hyphomicrobiaceae bacterium]